MQLALVLALRARRVVVITALDCGMVSRRKFEELAATQTEHGIVLSAEVNQIKKLKGPPPALPNRPIGFMAD